MIKKTKMFILAAAMIALSAGLFAQESNTLRSTFGEIVNNADLFLDVNDWKDVNAEIKNVFLFSRLGANTNKGILELGTAFKAGSSLYLGLYYNGDVTAQYGESGRGEKVDIGDDVKISASTFNKDNPHATYVLFAGIGGLGLKFSFTDEQQIRDTGSSGTIYNQILTGELVPAFEISGAGVIESVSLTLPINFNRTVSKSFAGTLYTHTVTTGNLAVAASDAQDFFAIEDANYVALQPAVTFKFGDNFKLDEELFIPIYGLATRTEANKGGSIPGVGSSATTYNTASGATNTYLAKWDSRFHILNTLTPTYNISREVGKVNFSLTGALPFELGLTTHSANGKAVGSETKESKGFQTQADFTIGIAPAITAGVQFKPAEIFSLQGGLGLEIFDLSGTFSGGKIKGLDGDDAVNAALFGWLGGKDDVKTSGHEGSFTYPKLEYSLGFTFNLKAVMLDFSFVQELNPALTTGVYEGVGATLGGPEASIVLTAQF